MPQRLTIIGLGLLGGSLGLARKSFINPYHITGCAHRDGSLIRAKNLGAIDDFTLDPADAVRDADFVVLCPPVGQIDAWLTAIGPHLKAGAIVTDVGSTKAGIVAAGERAIRPPAHFVGSHPMAGGSQAGIDAARADLFAGAVCITTPTDRTDPAAIETVEDFWKSLRMRVVRHAPDEHDRLVGWVSHLPHVVAAALVARQDAASLDLRGRGFMDSTRIAAGDAGLWRDIFAANRENVSASLSEFIEELLTVRHLLDSGDLPALESWLATQAQKRRGLE